MFLLEIPPFQGFRIDLHDVPIGVLSENVVVLQHYEAPGVLRPAESVPGALQAAADGLGGVAPPHAQPAPRHLHPARRAR